VTYYARAYRIVDGERIDGTRRSVFVHNGDYHLADLVVYADGVIGCWGEMTLPELRDHLRTGWVTLRPEAGAIGDAGFARWRFTEPQSWLTVDDFVAEIADEIERLAGRPTTADRCQAALDRYRHDPSEDNRLALRAAYLEVPTHLRQYLCFDMDRKDWPIRVLITENGAPVYGTSAEGDDDDLVTAEWRADVLRHLARRERAVARVAVRDTADGPAAPRSATVLLAQGYNGNFSHRESPGTPGDVGQQSNLGQQGGRPGPPGPDALRAEYPAAIDVGGLRYPTVTHAYWALSVDDANVRDAIRGASTVLEVRALAVAARRRDGWAEARTAVMAALLRAKFAQHPPLAQALLATGDGRIDYAFGESDFWNTDERGRGWLGRLLELIRAELIADHNGLTF
jgi:predicted NAD-dependent protein-ADP-ribosyltransferase YbiA (DUF1768 family)